METTISQIKHRLKAEYNLLSNVDATTYRELTERFMEITIEELHRYEEENGIKSQWNRLLENLKIV